MHVYIFKKNVCVCVCVCLYKNIKIHSKHTHILYKQFFYFGCPAQFFIIVFEVYAHSGCIHLIKNRVDSNIVKYYYNLKIVFNFNLFINVIYYCDGSATFSAAFSL